MVKCFEAGILSQVRLCLVNHKNTICNDQFCSALKKSLVHINNIFWNQICEAKKMNMFWPDVSLMLNPTFLSWFIFSLRNL